MLALACTASGSHSQMQWNIESGCFLQSSQRGSTRYPSLMSLSFGHTASQATARSAPFWRGVRASAALDSMTCLGIVKSTVPVGASNPFATSLLATRWLTMRVQVCLMCQAMRRGLVVSKLSWIPASVTHSQGCEMSHPRRLADMRAAPMGPRTWAHPVGGRSPMRFQRCRKSRIGKARQGWSWGAACGGASWGVVGPNPSSRVPSWTGA